MILPHIDLRKVRHAAVLARAGSFIKAAQELNLTQSALTRSIQALESQLGVRLFDRDRSGVHPTVVGREFLERGQELIIGADDLAQFMERTTKAEFGQVSFGLSPLPAKLFLSPLLLDLFDEKPEIHCSVAVRNPDELLELLESDKIEFFLGTYLPADRSIQMEVRELAIVETVLVVRRGHPLAKRELLSVNDIGGFPVLLSLFEPVSAELRRFLSGHRQTISTDDYSALMRSTLESDAIWLSSMLAGNDTVPHPDLVRLPLTSPLAEEVITLKSIRRVRRTLSPLAQHILRNLQDRCGEPVGSRTRP